MHGHQRWEAQWEGSGGFGCETMALRTQDDRNLNRYVVPFLGTGQSTSIDFLVVLPKEQMSTNSIGSRFFLYPPVIKRGNTN